MLSQTWSHKSIHMHKCKMYRDCSRFLFRYNRHKLIRRFSCSSNNDHRLFCNNKINNSVLKFNFNKSTSNQSNSLNKPEQSNKSNSLSNRDKSYKSCLNSNSKYSHPKRFSKYNKNLNRLLSNNNRFSNSSLSSSLSKDK